MKFGYIHSSREERFDNRPTYKFSFRSASLLDSYIGYGL